MVFFFHSMNVSSTESKEKAWRPNTSDHVTILWCTVFTLTCIAILCANTLAITVFIVKRLLRKSSNILLLNLATADLMIGGFAMPMYITIFYKSLRGYEWYNRILNEIYICLDIFAGLSSMFILAVIALERVYSVFYPFKHRCTPRRFYWSAVAFAWIMAGCLASLKLLASRKTLPLSIDNHIILTFVSFALVTITVSYSSIWRRLYSRKTNSNVIVQEKPVAQAMLTVTVAFVGMWLPFFLLNVVGSFDSQILLAVPPDVIYFAKLMQYCNSLVNPIIYSLKIPQFRKALGRLGHKSSVRTVRSENV